MRAEEEFARQLERDILHRLNFEPSKGCRFDDLFGAVKLDREGSTDGRPNYRHLDHALQRLRRAGTIRYARKSRMWVIR